MAKTTNEKPRFNITKVEELIMGHGWSNSYFSSLFGKSETWITDWKRNKSLPDKNALAVIANKLDTTIEYLTDKTDVKNKPDAQSDELDKEVLDLLKRVPADKWDEVVRYLRFQVNESEKP